MPAVNRNIPSKISSSGVPKRRPFQFPPVSKVLGDSVNSKQRYEVRIINYVTNIDDRVIVYANNTGQVTWCLMGYLGVRLTYVKTAYNSKSGACFVENDVGFMKYHIIVLKM